jgi:hypothetical protein
MSRSPRFVVLLITTLLLPACSTDKTSILAGVMSSDTLADGTVVVRYGALPLGEVTVAEIDLRLGQVEGDTNLMFGEVRGIEAGRDGTIYVLDYQAAEIRAFDDEGRFVRKVVSRGRGPGEISEANGMVLVGDTVLWIQDHAQWMMIGVSTAGEELRRFPMHVLSYGYIWAGTVDNKGRVWKQQTHIDGERTGPPEPGLTEGSGRAYWVFYEPDADVKDSIYLGEDSYRTMISRTGGGGYSYRPIPNDPRPIAVVDPDGGIWRTSGAAYRVVRLSERGDTVLVIESDTPALPVTTGDRSAYVEAVVERYPDQRRVAEEIAGLMPETKPAIASLNVDDEGRLWIGRVAPEDAYPQYDIFGRAGAYQGSVELAFQPARFIPIRIRHRRVYAVVRDSLDVPFVVRTRVIGDVPWYTTAPSDSSARLGASEG